jgi:RimJ/RimL family protein N-acetyltransferase
MIHLETERLILRNLRPEDAPVMCDYRNNEICAKYQRGQTKDFSAICELVEGQQWVQR